MCMIVEGTIFLCNLTVSVYSGMQSYYGYMEVAKNPLANHFIPSAQC